MAEGTPDGTWPARHSDQGRVVMRMEVSVFATGENLAI